MVGVRNSQAGVTLAAAARLWIPGSAGGLDVNAGWPILSPVSDQVTEGFAGTQTTITPPTDRSLGLTSIPLAKGYLVASAVRATAGAPQRGQCLVSLYLQRGAGGAATTYQLLGQDYVTAQTGVGWPGGRMISGPEGPGKLSVLLGAQPPAGQDMNFTVPTAARWRVRAFGGHFRTSIVVANRLPVSLITVGGNAIGMTNGISQAASIDADFQWIIGLPLIQQPGAPDQLWLPEEIFLGPGDKIGTRTINLDAGDQWSGIYAYIEEVIQD